MKKGVAFLDKDFTIPDFLKFGLQQWNQCTSHMHQQALAIAEAKNIEEIDSPEAMEEDQLEEDKALLGKVKLNMRTMSLPICTSLSHELSIYTFVMR